MVLSMLGENAVPKSSDDAVNVLAHDVSDTQAKILKENENEKLENPTPPTEGFNDKDGVNPQPNRNDQPAVHRVARGNLDDTSTC
jgi:hypothetical protein